MKNKEATCIPGKSKCKLTMFEDMDCDDCMHNKNRKVPHTTIKNACPDCGGDMFDGTSTGWMICNKCGLMI